MDDLLAAIVAAPDDDAPRLVYADWLQQEGHPRGELIVLGCALARLAAHDPRRRELIRRIAAVTHDGHAALALAGEGAASFADVERGFPTTLRLPMSAIDQLPGYLARIPITRLVVTGWRDGELPPLFGCSLGGVRELALRGRSIDGAGVWGLAAWPALAQVVALELGGTTISPDALRHLLASPHLGALRALTLRANQLRADPIERVATSPLATQLEALEIVDNRVTPAGIAALRELTALRRLTIPDLDLTPAALAPLVAVVPQLESLTLSSTRLGARFASALAAAPPGRQRVLHLHSKGTSFGIEGMRALATAAFIPQLTALAIGSGIGDEGVVALVAAGGLRALVELSLASNSITEAGVRALVESPDARGLRSLSLANNRLDDAAATAMMASSHLDDLAHLEVQANPLSEAALGVLRGRFG